MKSLLDELKNEVHVWYCNPRVIQDESKLAAYKSVLSDQEVEQYQRYLFDKDRHSYLVSHALLRHSLSHYAEVPASQWRFTKNEHGKPALILPDCMPAISFNLTHTDGLSACVVALDLACGIDAENINRKNALQAVANRMFADEELSLLDKEDIQQSFFYYWTLREAYVKALGTGLSGSSKDFYFDVSQEGMNAEVHHRDRQVDSGWRFRLFQPTPEHVLSVACKSDNPVEVRLRELIP
jgi:4'-phosphopantetheinyl transferase